MEIIEIVLISLGVAADAFAVAICKGLSLTHINIKKCIIVGMWFGFFQFFMPLIGFYFGISFKKITGKTPTEYAREKRKWKK